MTDDVSSAEETEHLAEEVEFWTDSAVGRLDFVHYLHETIAAHSNGQPEIDAAQHAQEMIENAQVDLQDLQDEAKSSNRSS